MSHPKTDICLVYKSPGRVLPRVDVVNEVLFHVGDGLQQSQPDVLGVSVGDVRELSLAQSLYSPENLKEWTW